MAHYSLFAQKDTFLSNAKLFLLDNFGHDAILEIEKVAETNLIDCRLDPYYTRALIKFDLTELSQSIVNGDIVDPIFTLNLKVIEAKEIPLEYTIDVHPISQSWEMGVGRKFDHLTEGASWKFRDLLNGKMWVTGSLTDKTGGGTWYSGSTTKVVNAIATGSLTITSLNNGDSFYITGSNGTIYTFVISSSVSSSNAKFANALINITAINENDLFVISGSIPAKLFANDVPVPPDVISSSVYNFYGSGSSAAVEAVTSINIESVNDGDVFYINGGKQIELIASDIPVPVDVPEAGLFFFHGAEHLTSASNLPDSVFSMSIEITNISGLNISASVSGTLLQLTSSNGVGDDANNYVFTISSSQLSSSFSGGKPSSLRSLMYKINSVNTLNITASTSASNLILSSSLAGLIGNTFSFTSGSTVTSLTGGTVIYTIIPSVDDPINNIFYFDTGSSLNNSVSNLENKIISQSLSFVSTNISSSTLQFTSSVYGIVGELIGVQSGGFQQTLQGGTSSSIGQFSSSQHFVFEVADIKMDVTNMMIAWLNSTIPNEGLILKYTDAEEKDTKNYGKLRFYGMDTNTIYSPHIDISWDDSIFSTGSLEPVTENSKVVYVRNLNTEYKAGNIIRLDIFSREKFPTKTFDRTSDYLHLRYLPKTTYYSIKDGETEETIIDFDEFTKVSCDENGNYFTLNTSGFGQERFFKIIIKVVEDGKVEYFDNNSLFKITR